MGLLLFKLYQFFWLTVKYVGKINLKVIPATADGASQNRNFLGCINIFLMIQMLMLFNAQKIFIQKKISNPGSLFITGSMYLYIS